MSTPVEFVGVDPAVIKELVSGRHAREVLELSKLKNQYAQYAASPEGEHKCAEGLGQMKMSIPALAYHYWNRREPGCWDDKSFKREFERDNPGVKVKTFMGTKAQVSMAGLDYAGHNKRFVKKYEHGDQNRQRS